MTLPTNPAEFPRRILLAVTGLSPQILTETLYALAVAEPHFVPTEIHLLTTSTGKDLARTALLHPDGGQFHALLADYPQIGRPAFNEQHIHVIGALDCAPLPDIRSPEENTTAADAITALVAELTRDETAALHVSIAGGRKTMGFYLGYAFSLYARPQDSLSHVLVSAPFESHPEFFFPPATPRRLTTRDNKYIDTADAVVTLAEIPVVRLRHGLPLALQEGRDSFSKTVSALQASFAPPNLVVSLADCNATCGQSDALKLSPASLAWLAWWANNALAGKAMQHWREANVQTYLALYERIVGRDAAALEKARKRLKDGMEQKFFEENNSKLERALRTHLGQAAFPYLLATIGKRPYTQRGLTLPPHAIKVV